MTTTKRPQRWVAAAGLGLGLSLSLAACGGNLDSSGAAAASETYPNGPITMLVGQDAGGSTDLIARALADTVSDDLGVPVTVENRPGANGAVAAKELAGAKPDGQTLMTFVGSLAYITPLAVGEAEALDINDYTVVTGISQDDYVLVTNPDSGFKTVKDIVDAGKPITFGTTGVGTGSQLSQELLFKQAKIKATAVLGGQVDVASVQLGEAIGQIKGGKLVPIVTFAKERVKYLPDTPTAVEAGYSTPVQQSRAIVAPKGTSAEVVTRLDKAFRTAFASDKYKAFNTERLLTPNEVSGKDLLTQWTTNLETYRGVVKEYGINLSGGK
jgi:tripartite-type tricarboxylate transporter receptor subunit TctC